jgi:putative methyltransferase
MPKPPKKLKPVFAARPPQQQQQQQQRASKKPKQQTVSQSPHKLSQGTRKHPSAAFKHINTSHNTWQCSSVIDQQSSEVLDKLLSAAETRRGGATIKSLTLAPHIVHKKPTFAVTCETLKHLPLLKQLVAGVGFLQQHQQQVWGSWSLKLI